MNPQSSEVVFAKSIRGSFPIRVSPGGGSGFRAYEMLSSSGSVVATYGSAQSLITAMTGNPNHGLTFEGYFGSPPDPTDLLPPGGSVLDLFTGPRIEVPQDVIRRAQQITVARGVATSAPRTKAQAAFTVTSSSPSLGIDLAKRGHEVRKLLFAGFSHLINRAGYDPEDVLQEVYRGILARNKGKCPFDARKSSFGHYVYLVIDCVLKNYHRREQRRREVEQIGMTTPVSMRDDEPCSTVDAASVADRVLVAQRGHWAHPEGDDTGDALRRLGEHLRRKMDAGFIVDPIETQVAGLLQAGLNRREIAQQIGVSTGRVGNAITSLREHAADWR